jgi:hypothetical protein
MVAIGLFIFNTYIYRSIDHNHGIAISKAEPDRTEPNRDLLCPAARTSGASLVTRRANKNLHELDDTAKHTAHCLTFYSFLSYYLFALEILM